MTVVEEKSLDWFLQLVFGIALVFVIVVFYMTRIVGIRASVPDNSNVNLYVNSSAFELEQSEYLIESKIRLLKADYTAELLLYQSETLKIKSSLELSELEKREKMQKLNELYGEEHFKNKQSLLEQEYKKLEYLKRVQCAKFCEASDLP